MGYGSRAIQQLVDYYSGALMSLEMGEEEKDKDIPLYTDGPVGPRDLQKPLLCALPLERWLLHGIVFSFLDQN